MKTGRVLFIGIIFITLLIPSVHALKQPEQYEYGQCELIAKDYQKAFYGDLIFIQPLNENGDFDFGGYNGHWINKAWNKERGIYYIDYKSQTYFKNTDEIKEWYKRLIDKKSVVYNINQEGAPFGIIYYY